MKISLSWRYLLAFCALTILCGTSHEFVHHFTGAALCGHFGTKTFNSFTLAAGCDSNLVAVYWSAMAGPIFTFGLLWVGYFLLRRADAGSKGLGFALIFANFPINRMLFCLLNSNDEQYANRLLFGNSPLVFWLTIIVIWAIALPPLIEAYRQLENRPKAAWFIGFFVLPFIFVIGFAGLFLEQFLLVDRQVLASSVLGIPYLILLVEILSAVVYEVFRKNLRPMVPLPN
ncbi:MAG: hypothetical protein M3N19_01895 [Candidatus Eremiobacteraeota bacterium]|nr:hypothetical protein [Candidatus Eremiobacteraeota bacterium]